MIVIIPKLGIFLILQDFKFTRTWTFYYGKKRPHEYFLRKIKRIAHDDFSVCSLYNRSFCHGLTLTGFFSLCVLINTYIVSGLQ